VTGWRQTVVVTALSLLLALILGGVLIVVADPDVRAAAGYFFARPSDLLTAAWDAVSSAYSALFQGAFVDFGAGSLGAALRPLTETLTVAAPLIVAGLAVALPFKAGLFNIGAEGQIVLGAATAGYLGFALDLPPVAHLLVAVGGGALAGAVWAGTAGLLKARTGAHEVITTIMLNYIALYLLDYLLTTSAFLRPGRVDPISPPVSPDAEYPLLAGESYRLHAGLLVSLAAAGFVWWLLTRSTVGFRYRAVGANPAAARTAGMAVERSVFTVMCVAGALAGLAGTMQILGTEKSLTGGISAGIGFDAITVALLGRGSPLGVVLAGILFGGLNAGGIAMQAQTGTPIDLVLVIQSLIVLFIAAPPLVRAVFRLRTADGLGGLQMSKGWGA
jgi:simple sugar transport system permease protein